jgi:hypothetical protein
MANKKTNWTAWVLKFVGSLAYLYVVWQLWAGVGPAGIFGPILFGLAVVMAVGFFIMTLVSLMSNNDELKDGSMKSSLLTGFALLALLAPTAATAAWGSWAWIALVGFILAYVGTGMDKHA